MRLVFFYVSWKHGYGENIAFNPKIKSDNFYSKRFEQEGYCLLLKALLDNDLIDDVLIVIESKSSPGYFEALGMPGLVIPSIANFYDFLQDDDIIWVRGGWKHWYDHLIEWQKQGHWMMIYAANTGRQKWDFWDVVLNDLDGSIYIDESGRLQYSFIKPINEKIFRRMPDQEIKYDIMIGASHIHDKKGQWRVIDAMIEYKKIFNEDLKAILPGSFQRGIKTNEIIPKIKEHNLSVYTPGMMNRKELALAMNQTRLFVHLGSHGQGDRGPMEAMACGCDLMIGFPQYHAHWLVFSFAKQPNDPEITAHDLRCAFKSIFLGDRKYPSEYHSIHAGLHEAIRQLIPVLNMFAFRPNRSEAKQAKKILMRGFKYATK